MYRLITANRNYSSWSLRPWVLMKTLGIPFEDEFVTFAGLDNYEDFRSFAPNGMVPVLIDGERTVWDSLGSRFISATGTRRVAGRRGRQGLGAMRRGRDAQRLCGAPRRLHDECRRARGAIRIRLSSSATRRGSRRFSSKD